MKKEDLVVLGQLLSAMKDATEKIVNSKKQKDTEQLMQARREILRFQKKIELLLGK
jgi:hypothetical protein